MEKFLTDDLIAQVGQLFGKLTNPVQVLLFTSKDKQETCEPTQQLLEEVVELSDLLSLSVFDIGEHADLASLYKVQDKAPAIVIAAMESTLKFGKESNQVTDYGIRILGIPAGHEFATLINDLLLVSGRDSGLSPQTRKYIKGLAKPLHLEVFVTPT